MYNPVAESILSACLNPPDHEALLAAELERAAEARRELAAYDERLRSVSESEFIVRELMTALGGGPRVGLPAVPPPAGSITPPGQNTFSTYYVSQ